MRTRPAQPSDFPRVLELNAESVQYLSPLDRARLETLAAAAHAFRVVEHEGQVVAFLLVFRDGSTYDSENFQWFDTRYDRFLYVDRIVVSKQTHGVGLGTMLYRELFALAGVEGAPIVTCEIDLKPPNPASFAFHARHGFAEVGQQSIRDGLKVVSMQVAPVVSNETAELQP